MKYPSSTVGNSIRVREVIDPVFEDIALRDIGPLGWRQRNVWVHEAGVVVGVP